MGAKGHKFELIEASGDGNIVCGAAKWSAYRQRLTAWSWISLGAGPRRPSLMKQADGSLKIRMHTFN